MKPEGTSSTEMSLTELEQLCFEMISLAGEGKSLVQEAIKAYYTDDIITSKTKLDEAENLIRQAHKIQFISFITPQAKGVKIPFHLLLIHAMDTLMTSASELDMAKLMIASKLSEKDKNDH